MTDSKFITAPLKTDKMPPGIPFIIATEAAERFSFYGMRAILVVFMTQYLRDATGALAVMSENEANQKYHLFLSLGYFLPVAGAILADVFFGKYRTIFWLSIVYCFGHLALALDETRMGLMIGLVLVAIGMGGIKPCVSAIVGDQFGTANQHLLAKAFGWFYFAINSGSLVAYWLTPLLLKNAGPGWAFGVPGIFMALALGIFWWGRHRFVHIPPDGGPFLKIFLSRGALLMYVRWALILGLGRGTWLFAYHWMKTPLGEIAAGGLSLIPAAGVVWILHRLLPRPELDPECAEGWLAIGRIAAIYVFVAVFWSLWDQSGSEWVLQAEKMDRQVTLLGYSFEILSSQMQVFNACFILGMIVVCNYVVYPLINRVFPLNELRKIGLGLVVTAASFLIAAWIESQITAGHKLSILWQLPAFLLLSTGEVMVSVTALEFAYTQAPKRMKSIVMVLYMWAISAGNLFTALVHKFIANPDGTTKLPGATFYLFFIGLCLATAVVYIFVARLYTPKTYLQDEAPAAS